MIEGLCAYCGERKAVSRDHVVPRALRKHYLPNRKVDQRPKIPRELMGTVVACAECNVRKATRRLVPPSWAEKIDALNAFFGGVEWRVWQGSTSDPAYRDAWLPELQR